VTAVDDRPQAQERFGKKFTLPEPVGIDLDSQRLVELMELGGAQ